MMLNPRNNRKTKQSRTTFHNYLNYLAHIDKPPEDGYIVDPEDDLICFRSEEERQRYLLGCSPLIPCEDELRKAPSLESLDISDEEFKRTQRSIQRKSQQQTMRDFFAQKKQNLRLRKKGKRPTAKKRIEIKDESDWEDVDSSSEDEIIADNGKNCRPSRRTRRVSGISGNTKDPVIIKSAEDPEIIVISDDSDCEAQKIGSSTTYREYCLRYNLRPCYVLLEGLEDIRFTLEDSICSADSSISFNPPSCSTSVDHCSSKGNNDNDRDFDSDEESGTEEGSSTNESTFTPATPSPSSSQEKTPTHHRSLLRTPSSMMRRSRVIDDTTPSKRMRSDSSPCSLMRSCSLGNSTPKSRQPDSEEFSPMMRKLRKLGLHPGSAERSSSFRSYNGHLSDEGGERNTPQKRRLTSEDYSRHVKLYGTPKRSKGRLDHLFPPKLNLSSLIEVTVFSASDSQFCKSLD